MSPRIDQTKVALGALQAMYGLEKYLAECAIEQPLRNLIKVRASQINGCAYCIDMHWKDARVKGESEQRLYGLSAWREAPYYSERERAGVNLGSLNRGARSKLPTWNPGPNPPASTIRSCP